MNVIKIHPLLHENQTLCSQLAKLQKRASELLHQKAVEIEQLYAAMDFLSSELKQRDQEIAYLRAKLEEFRKGQPCHPQGGKLTVSS